ncbi:serum paraoxonase/arylesterase [Neolentinus lepideus HHB14362 ss-1]|uniref:Serum paraoxonase/arylesterase n=1 Tax=Neolentinus lepideus HHB14362 ss-1 TaxID=1314782 RepID=A0A165TJH5_9AGAM|nr:serum paraoxonase/arylesterase [Neolentinus lepideus HHB14362 ss-1]
MTRVYSLATVLVVAICSLVVFYHAHLKPRLRMLGVGRQLDPRGNTQCRIVPELQACEKIVLHEATGLLYLACSTQSSRTHWTPAISIFNSEGMSREDHVAVYDPETSKITRLRFRGYDFRRDISLHGMDVVPSASNPNELFVYLVNHRRPLRGLDPKVYGADSSIEIFKTSIGSPVLNHIRTVEDPVIKTPNDVAGSPTGRSFHFTNDHGSKTGFSRHLEAFFGWPLASIGYCEISRGCKFAAKGLPGPNGITRAMNDTYYVASSSAPQLRVLQRQPDDTLLVKDVIAMDRLMDNIALDQDGTLWAAGFPMVVRTRFKHFMNPSIKAPSSAHQISLANNDGFGRKYGVEKVISTLSQVFEDDGTIASGTTSVVHDSRRGRLFLHGFAAPHLTVCNSPTSMHDNSQDTSQFNHYTQHTQQTVFRHES